MDIFIVVFETGLGVDYYQTNLAAFKEKQDAVLFQTEVCDQINKQLNNKTLFIEIDKENIKFKDSFVYDSNNCYVWVNTIKLN